MKYFKYFLYVPFIFFLMANFVIAQDMEKSLFSDVDKMIEEAQQLDMNLLSPSNFEQAFTNYREAKSDFNEGANLNDIREKIDNTIKYLNSAKEKAEVSKITLKTALKARSDAIKVEAQEHASEIWAKAEDKFRDAGEEVEDGDIPDAEEAAAEAEKLYRSAELNSIKVLYLDETWKLINQAKEEDSENYTPKTLEKAITLVGDAEKELTENRYDPDLPRNLAQQAKYEANHAIFLTNFLKGFEENDITMEELLLSYETPIQKIASHFDYHANFDQPFEAVANEIVKKIVDLKTELQHSKEAIIDNQNEIEILKEQLGGLSKEKSELDEKMKNLAEIKAKYEKINTLFNDNEAVILKEGSNIIIRLIGLNFAVGKSIIEAENFALLTKVQNAIKEFPESSIIVEGHTDSYGSDEKNLELSTERAASVKQYLLANMNLDPTKVSAFGYGETKPIANNETKDGRAKNRRIDLIIKNAE